MSRLIPASLALVLTLALGIPFGDAAAGAAVPPTLKDCPECPEMQVIPAGKFLMGSSALERQREGVPETFGNRERMPMAPI